MPAVVYVGAFIKVPEIVKREESPGSYGRYRGGRTPANHRQTGRFRRNVHYEISFAGRTPFYRLKFSIGMLLRLLFFLLAAVRPRPQINLTAW